MIRGAILLLVIASSIGGLFAQDVVRIIPSATVDLRDAYDLSISASGTLYIADTGHHRIIAVDSSGRAVAETGGFGTSPGQFQWPRAVVADRGNAVWVLDYGNRRIEKLSRSLEYQGTLLIPGDDGTRGQPETMALSPQGDLYVFDREGGRLLRYDPLFNLQGELGQGTGAQFISNISAITFVPRRGLFWWSRGSDVIECSDALLNMALPLRLSGKPERMELAARDSCLLLGYSRRVDRQCGISSPPEVFLSEALLASAGIQNITALAISADGTVFLLDGGANAVYRIRMPRE